MAHLEVEIHDKTMVIRSQAFCCNFPDVGKNKKAVLVFLRALCSPGTGKALFTYQCLADAFGDAARQNVSRYLKELLALPTVSAAKKKEIVEVFPDVQAEKQRPSIKKAIEVSTPAAQKKLLVVLLYICNVSQDMLLLLFGVGKTSIHNAMYAVCSEELEWQILRAIVCWSGTVSVDEKWLWIDERWHFALCAVDSVTGVPLLMTVSPTLDSVKQPTITFRPSSLARAIIRRAGVRPPHLTSLMLMPWK